MKKPQWGFFYQRVAYDNPQSAATGLGKCQKLVRYVNSYEGTGVLAARYLRARSSQPPWFRCFHDVYWLEHAGRQHGAQR